MNIHLQVADAFAQLHAAKTQAELQAAIDQIHAAIPEKLTSDEQRMMLTLLDDLQPLIDLFATKARTELAIAKITREAWMNFQMRAIGIDVAAVQ